MSYALARGEPIGPGLRRIILEEAASAAERLEGSGPDSRDEAVHETRKGLKKCRAVLRLSRPSIGSLYGEANAAFRDIGRSLSEIRDAQILVATLDELVAASADGAVDDLVAPIRTTMVERAGRLAAERGAARSAAEWAAARIRRVATVVAEDGWGGDGWGFVDAGLTREYRRGRSALSDASRHPHAETVHEWRKRAKDHWYHLRLLKEAWKPVMRRTAKAAHELSDLLGDHHDLAVLELVLREEPDPTWGRVGVETVIAMAERRSAELLAEAEPLGRRLYAERPARFAARLRGYWKVSRSEARATAGSDARQPAGA